jgi:hypothetical protein
MRVNTGLHSVCDVFELIIDLDARAAVCALAGFDNPNIRILSFQT